MTWAGTAVAAQVTTPRAREIIAAVALTALGIVALTAALVFDATMAIFSPALGLRARHRVGRLAAPRMAGPDLGAVLLKGASR